MNQKEKTQAREDLYTTISNAIDTVGRTKEGLLVQLPEGYASVKVIIKNDDFDAEDKMEEYQEAEQKKAEAKAKKEEK